MYNNQQFSAHNNTMSGVHGNLLEATVVACNKLKDTEWISRQDPYVCLEYGSTKYRTRTCTDGGKHPTFQEKFTFSMIEGLRELNVVVWNSNTITFDDFIGSGKIQLQKVISEGYDDSSWPIQTKTGRIFVKGKELWRHVDDSNPSPDKDKDKDGYDKWEVKDAQVMAWILGSVEPNIILNLRSSQTAASDVDISQ